MIHQGLQIQPFSLCGNTAQFTFYKNKEIELLTIDVHGVAKASIYCYIDDYSTVYLANLFVLPEYRNRGVGEQLQIIREQIGKDVKAELSCLWVKKETWMYQWYEKRGYSYITEHQIEGYVWMQKSLI